MDQKIRDKAEKLFRSKYEQLTQIEKHVAQHITEKTPISTNVIRDFSEQLTFGRKMADKVTSFGGSWIFISLFMGLMVLWILLNSFILVKLNGSFDPYPYILLNLVLSMLAAIQAPIIKKSRRVEAAIAYTVKKERKGESPLFTGETRLLVAAVFRGAARVL